MIRMTWYFIRELCQCLVHDPAFLILLSRRASLLSRRVSNEPHFECKFSGTYTQQLMFLSVVLEQRIVRRQTYNVSIIGLWWRTTQHFTSDVNLTHTHTHTNINIYIYILNFVFWTLHGKVKTVWIQSTISFLGFSLPWFSECIRVFNQKAIGLGSTNLQQFSKATISGRRLADDIVNYRRL